MNLLPLKKKENYDEIRHKNHNRQKKFFWMKTEKIHEIKFHLPIFALTKPQTNIT